MYDCIVVGAGATGLVCANYLHERGKSVLVLEREAYVGGRLATERSDQFLFDRGFQVLLTAYPAVKRWINLPQLGAGAFAPGATLLRPDGTRELVGDPLRDPSALMSTIRAGVATLADKARLLKLVAYVRSKSCQELFDTAPATTEHYLRDWGFSESFIDGFFRPFYGGIFLERELVSSSKLFLFTFKMFAEGEAVLPRNGIQAVAEHLARRLPPEAVQTKAEVTEFSHDQVRLESGLTHVAKAVVDARSMPLTLDGARSTVNLQYATSTTSLDPRYIALPPVTGAVNNIAVLDGAQANYSATDEHLISLTLMDAIGKDAATYDAAVRESLAPWLADELPRWRLLKSIEVPYALPDGRAVRWTADPEGWLDSEGVLRAGDYRLHPSLQAAMHAGELAGQWAFAKTR